MIPVAFITLGLALLVTAAPATAQTFAECQAYLCLPGGFPPSECTPAERAVERRLLAGQPALPSWSSCAAAFGWDSANLSHNERHYEECPHGGTLSGGQCRGTDQNGDGFCYTPRQNVRVQVVVDGSTSFTPNIPMIRTLRAAGTPVTVINPTTCSPPHPPPPPPPPPTPPPTGVCCPATAVNYYWTGVPTATTKRLVCTHTFSYPPPQYPSPLNAPPPQRAGEPYNPPNCCPPWALYHQWAFDRNSLTCVLGGILPN